MPGGRRKSKAEVFCEGQEGAKIICGEVLGRYADDVVDVRVRQVLPTVTLKPTVTT